MAYLIGGLVALAFIGTGALAWAACAAAGAYDDAWGYPRG